MSQEYTFISYDEAYEAFSLVLSNYSLEEIPTESSEGLRWYLMDLYEQGHIKTLQDMYRETNHAIERGWTKGRFFNKKYTHKC